MMSKKSLFISSSPSFFSHSLFSAKYSWIFARENPFFSFSPFLPFSLSPFLPFSSSHSVLFFAPYPDPRIHLKIGCRIAGLVRRFFQHPRSFFNCLHTTTYTIDMFIIRFWLFLVKIEHPSAPWFFDTFSSFRRVG